MDATSSKGAHGVVSQVDLYEFDVECAMKGIHEISEERLQVEHRAEPQARLANCPLIVVASAIYVTIEGCLETVLKWTKENGDGYGQDDRLEDRDLGSLEAGDVMKGLRQAKECRSSDNNSAHVDHAVANDETDIHQAMSNDGMRNDCDHRHPEERPIWTEFGGVEDKGNEQIRDGRAQGGDENGDKEIAYL